MTQKSDEERAQELAQEVFSKCFLVMLAHIQRRIAKDPNYEEPKFLRAFLVAFEGINKPVLKDGERFMGIASAKDPAEAYAVVLEKHGRSTEILELRDITRDKTVGQREIMRLMQLSILLDNIPSDSVDWAQATAILNNSVPGIRFVKFPNNQWKKYRPLLIKEIRQGKMPQIELDSDGVKKLQSAISFSQVPQVLRSNIGVLYAQTKYPEGGTFSVTSPDKTVDKSRVFEMAKDVIYGYGAEYMNPLKLPEEKDD